MCPSGVKAGLPLVTQGPLNHAHYRQDVIDQLGRHCIACVFVDYFEFSRD